MEKLVGSKQIIKWHVILGAVMCAIVAFCALPNVVIAADAKTEMVEYIDREWKDGQVVETIKSQECTVLDKEQCDKELNSGWYVLNSSFKYKKHVNINENQDVKIILKDDCILTATKKGFSVKDGAVLTVYGQSNGTGKLDLDGDSGDAGLRVPEGATLNIKGGIIVAEGTYGGAGIGGDKDKKESAGSINILGGNVTATGSESAAGIGGGDGGDGGEVKISGGTVTATGGSGGAGIGGGIAGDGGETTISGGTVTATGDAAGIGGGYASNGGTTIISGGTVTAQGGYGAAGIGGGENCTGGKGGNGGETTISGGTVTAIGGEYGAGIGGGFGGDYFYGNGGNGGETIISGGTVTATGGEYGAGIGGGRDGSDGKLDITGGNIKVGYTSGTTLPKHTITLKGLKEAVEIVGVNCDYGVNDVYTLHDVKEDEDGNESLDEGKLYFYMTEEEYAKLTEIIVKDKDGKEKLYLRDGSSDNFVNETKVIITGVEAQNGVYSGLPQIGYRGTPTNEQGYKGEYETVYYYLNKNKYEITNKNNSGATGEGKAPVYAGEYKVRISVPSSDEKYGGYCDVEFKVEKITPRIIKEPTLSGVYGTAVKDMSVVDGLVMLGDMYEPGIWEVTDERKADIPGVGTTEAYEMTFTPIDTRKCNSVTTMVVPEVEKASATVVEAPTLSGSYGTAVKDMEFTRGVVKVGDEQLEGTWTVTDDKSTDIPDVGTVNSYEVTFDSQNYRAATMVVPEVEKAIPYVTEKPIVRTDNGTSLEDIIIEGGKVTAKSKEIDGKWEAIDVILQSNPPSYLLKFTPTDERNYECTMVSVVAEANVEKALPEIVEAPTLSGVF